MADRALLLASLLFSLPFFAGCGGAAMEAAPNDASKGGGGKLVRDGDKTRALQIEDADGTSDGKKKSPEDLIAEGQGTDAFVAASSSPVQGAPPPLEKYKDKEEAAKPVAPPTGVRAAVVVDSSTPLGNGRLTQSQIAQILEKGGDVFGECYTLGAGGANKDFRATVTVKATIGPAGTVNAVEVTRSTANNPKVDACVAQAFKRVKFPAPSDGAMSVITFPITFNGIEAVH